MSQLLKLYIFLKLTKFPFHRCITRLSSLNVGMKNLWFCPSQIFRTHPVWDSGIGCPCLYCPPMDISRIWPDVCSLRSWWVNPCSQKEIFNSCIWKQTYIHTPISKSICLKCTPILESHFSEEKKLYNRDWCKKYRWSRSKLFLKNPHFLPNLYESWWK